jgi:predicted permease
MGVYCLTKEKKYMTLKAALLNPSTLGFVVAFPCYLFSASTFLPSLLQDGISLLGKMTTPLCMLILGIRLATVPFGKLFRRPIVYLISLFKLLVFPLFCYGAIYFLPLPMPFKASILILAGTPCASIILNLAEIHHSETEISANCVLVSTLLCIVTIPFLTLLVG